MKRSKEIELRVTQYLRLLRFHLQSGRHQGKLEIGRVPERRKPGQGPVIFTAADGPYLRRFFRTFALSAAAHDEAPRIHVHLYNPQPEDFALLDTVAGELPQLSLSWSREEFSPEARERRSASSDMQSWKSLYICTSRFMAADAVQQASEADLLITDIDILFNGNVSRRFRGDFDVSLLLRPKQRNICKRTLGGVVFASARPAGRMFLSRTARDISRFLAAGHYWFAFDQLALYRAVSAMRKSEFAERFSPMTNSDICFDLGQHGLILYPKGKLKDQQEFAALLQSYAPPPETR